MILMIIVLLLMAGFLPFIPLASAEPPSKAPPDYSGILPGDTTITKGTYTFDDLIVDGRFTLTIEAGVILLPEPDAFFYVNGKMIVEKGASSSSVSFGSATGSDWRGITVTSTGNVNMQNFTIIKASSRALFIQGSGSTIKNCSIIGTAEGIYYQGTTGEHLLHNVMISSISNFGIVISNSRAHITLSRITIRYLAGSGIAITESSNVDVKGLTIMQTGGYCFYTINSHNITLDGFTFNDNTSTIETVGIYLLGSASDMSFSKGIIEGVNFAFAFATSMGERINFTNIETGNKVGEAVVNTVPTTRAKINFIDCVLRSSLNTTRIESSHDRFHVDLINTTWSKSSPFVLKAQAEINIYWYLEGEVVDGNGHRIDSSMTFIPAPTFGGIIDMPGGYLPKTAVKDRTIYSVALPTIYTNNYMFRSTEYPENMHTVSNVNIDEYTFWTIMLDLDPINTMPATLEVQEDVWLELNLYDHFDDPEGEELNYTFVTSDNITLEQIGGYTSGDIRIKNTVKNWFGTGWMNVKATDPAFNFSQVNVTIEVLPINDAPYFVEPLPAPVIDEDGWTWLNLTGRIADPEMDPITVSFPEGPNYELEWDATNLNLTITPAENFNGLLEIEVNLTDGTDWMVDMLYVIVRAVNDPPVFTLRYSNGDEVGIGEYPQPEGPPLSVYLFEIDEDEPVSFLIDVTDVDDTNLTYKIKPEQPVHGTIEIDPLDPKNFTYTPLANDFGGDLVRINVSDGKVTISKWIWFDVSAVNDVPVFDAPEEWEVSVDISTQFDLDIEDMISDVDGDELTISVDPDTYITISGTTLEILVTDSYKETFLLVTVTVSDGTVDVEKTLTIYMDNWVETFFETWDVIPKEDKWKVEVIAEEGLTLFLVVEDEDGNRTSYQMTYNEEGEYIAEIPEEAGMEGYPFWISEEENGDPISNDYDDILPALKEKGDGFPWWIILLIIIVIILAGVILYLVFARGGGYGGEVGEVEEE